MCIAEVATDKAVLSMRWQRCKYLAHSWNEVSMQGFIVKLTNVSWLREETGALGLPVECSSPQAPVAPATSHRDGSQTRWPVQVCMQGIIGGWHTSLGSEKGQVSLACLWSVVIPELLSHQQLHMGRALKCPLPVQKCVGANPRELLV